MGWFVWHHLLTHRSDHRPVSDVEREILVSAHDWLGRMMIIVFAGLLIAIAIVAVQTGLADYLIRNQIDLLHEMMDCGPYTPGAPVCI